MRLVVFAGASLLGLSAAHADFCELNARTVAEAAVALLTPGSTIQNYCKSCGDKAATSEVVESASMSKVPDSTEDIYVVSVNGHGVDIAHVFVSNPQGPGWAGLGALTKCSKEKDLMTWLPDGVEAR